MSFGKSRQKEIAYEFSGMCSASGCPMKGSVSHDGHRYACSIHAFADHEKWPQITSSILRNEKIRLGIFEVLKVSDADWQKGRYALMSQYFDTEPHLQPQDEELYYRAWYERRLINELVFRCGEAPKPVIRKKLDVPKRGGSFGGFLDEAGF